MAHTYVPGQLHVGPLDGDIIEAPRRENHQFPEPVIRVPVPVLDAALVARDRDRPSHRAGNGHAGEMGIKGVRPTPASIRAAQAAANRSPASLRCSSQVRASARCPASLSILAASLAANEPATAAPGPPSRREFRLAVECQESGSSVTPLLCRVGWSATWANVVEHAADPPGYWGSRGREFKSRRPDSVRVSAGHRLGLAERGGRPLTANGIKIRLRRLGEAAGVAGVHAHRWRHTFAHEWKRAGGDTGDLMLVLGWTSEDMPRHYGASAAAERALETQQRLGIGEHL